MSDRGVIEAGLTLFLAAAHAVAPAVVPMPPASERPPVPSVDEVLAIAGADPRGRAALARLSAVDRMRVRAVLDGMVRDLALARSAQPD